MRARLVLAGVEGLGARALTLAGDGIGRYRIQSRAREGAHLKRPVASLCLAFPIVPRRSLRAREPANPATSPRRP